jgi:hypothetical protein
VIEVYVLATPKPLQGASYATFEVEPPLRACSRHRGGSRNFPKADRQKQNVLVKQLPFVKSAISHGKGYVFLAKLKAYYDFITDQGKIVDSLFEFNVRDYQSTASVNKEIAATLLLADDQTDFW